MGRSVGQRPRPSTTCRSLWQTPVAAVRTRTSRPQGLSMSTDSIVSGSCGLRKTAALMSMACLSGGGVGGHHLGGEELDGAHGLRVAQVAPLERADEIVGAGGEVLVHVLA